MRPTFARAPMANFTDSGPRTCSEASSNSIDRTRPALSRTKRYQDPLEGGGSTPFSFLDQGCFREAAKRALLILPLQNDVFHLLFLRHATEAVVIEKC